MITYKNLSVRSQSAIAKFFWTKRIRLEVAKLKAESKLNETAYEFLLSATINHCIVALIVTGSLCLLEAKVIAIAALIGAPFAVRIDINFLFGRQMAAYLYGQRKEVIVDHVGISYYRSQSIFYTSDDGTTKQIYISAGPRFPKDQLPKPDDKISVYEPSEKGFRPMPDIAFLKATYSLIK